MQQRTLTLAADGVFGYLYLPAPGSGPHPAVLALGGSEGGAGQADTASLLAAHGYPALALAYFGEPGLPQTLNRIPLEYFVKAARLLARQPSVDPARIAVLGFSRGTEAALLLSQEYPDLFHGTVLYAPGASVHGGYPDGTIPAWLRSGQPVPPGPIPVTRVAGPVLALAGGSDGLWDAETSAHDIMSALDRAHNPNPHRALIYPGAGHIVGTIPFLATGTERVHPVSHQLLEFGGTRPADADAQARSWPQVLAMLADSAQ